jgi:hypothetical protein
MHEYRRYLVINFRVGTYETGHFVGPVLVSTPDYHRFHFWDEPDEAYLDEADYEVVRVYPLGCGQAEAQRRFAMEFAPIWSVGDLPLLPMRALPGFLPSLNHPVPVSAA